MEEEEGGMEGGHTGAIKPGVASNSELYIVIAVYVKLLFFLFFDELTVSCI